MIQRVMKSRHGRAVVQGTLSIWGLCPQIALSLGDFYFNPRKEKIACEKPLDNGPAMPAFHYMSHMSSNGLGNKKSEQKL